MSNHPGHAAHSLVANAESDVLAVAWATGFVFKLIEGWAESSQARREELWADAAFSNEALADRFRERIEALPVGES